MNMKLLQQYIMKLLGVELQYRAIGKNELGQMPYYIGATYRFYEVNLLNLSFILVEKQNPAEFSIRQTEIHFKLIREAFNKKVALLAGEMTSLNRRRLAEKGINFVVPGKQLFLPDFLIDLREDFKVPKTTEKSETLLPSAQVIVLHRILFRDKAENLEGLTFKKIAAKLDYTPMAITFAAENLKQNELCEITGEKEKYLKFNLEIPEMWHELEKRKLLSDPVIKRVFVDEIAGDPKLLMSGNSALPEYSDMNPSRQLNLAIKKSEYYRLDREKALVNPNQLEGHQCLEVWKYDPLVLASDLNNKRPVVDPLSLYLSFGNNLDERTEAALEQIIEKYIW